MTEMTSGIGNSAASRDKAYYLHPYTNLKTHEDVGPLVIERGDGVHVFDDSGKAYIEGMAGLWCTSLGFGEERLVEAASSRLPPPNFTNETLNDARYDARKQFRPCRH